MGRKKLEKIAKEARELAESSYKRDLEEALKLYLELASRYEEKEENDQAKIYAIEAISVCMNLDNGSHSWPEQAVDIARDYGLKDSFVKIGLELVERYQDIGSQYWMERANELMKEIKPLLYLIPDIKEQTEQNIRMYEAELRKTAEDDLVKRLHIYVELWNQCKMGGNEDNASYYISILRDLIDNCDAQTEPSKVLGPGDAGFDDVMRTIRSRGIDLKNKD